MKIIFDSAIKEIKRRLRKSELDVFSVVLILDNILYFIPKVRAKGLYVDNYFIKYSLDILTYVYSNNIAVFAGVILLILALVIYILIERNINLLPSKRKLSDGRVVGYSYLSGIVNIAHLVYYYSYSLHIVYLTVLMVNGVNNTTNLSFVSGFLIIVDEVVLVSKVIKAIFRFNYFEDFDSVINPDSLYTRYNVISETYVNGSKVMILKDGEVKGHPFYVVSTKALPQASIYTILNSSFNFDDIKYSYEYYIKDLDKK